MFASVSPLGCDPNHSICSQPWVTSLSLGFNLYCLGGGFCPKLDDFENNYRPVGRDLLERGES